MNKQCDLETVEATRKETVFSRDYENCLFQECCFLVKSLILLSPSYSSFRALECSCGTSEGRSSHLTEKGFVYDSFKFAYPLPTALLRCK